MIIGEVISEASFDSYQEDSYDYLFKNRKKGAHTKHGRKKHGFKILNPNAAVNGIVEFGKKHLIHRNFGLKPAQSPDEQVSGPNTADQDLSADQSENSTAPNQEEQLNPVVKDTTNKHPKVDGAESQSDPASDEKEEKEEKKDEASYSYQFDSFDSAKASSETPVKKDPAPEKKKAAFGSAFGWICLGITVVLVAVVVKSIEEHHHSSPTFTKKRYTL